MTTQPPMYQLWVNWDELIASFQPKAGFDALSFCYNENYQANLRILIQSGFRFQ